MSILTIGTDQFPEFPQDLQVGQIVQVMVVGRVMLIADSLVDVSTLGGPKQFIPSSRRTEILLTGVAHPEVLKQAP